MARFDYYRWPDGDGYLLDCQADVLEHLDTRLVVPLLPLAIAPKPAAHLNPVFDIAGEPYSMVTQFAATIPVNELRDHAGSLEKERYPIGNALDFLITGV